MLMPCSSPTASTDRVWSIMLSQLVSATEPREPATRQVRERRYAVQLVQRQGQEPIPANPAANPEVFDAMSCLLVACSSVGRDVAMQTREDAQPQISFLTRQHGPRVMARLDPVLASCNERLRDSPWEFVAVRMDMH